MVAPTSTAEWVEGVGPSAPWLLGFTSPDPKAPDGDGRPWGDGTAMAARAYEGLAPWDAGCSVTPMIGGDLTLKAICKDFEEAIAGAEAQAKRKVPVGQRGHVYIADWQLNALRDLSSDQPWGGGQWDPSTTVARDQTALGLVLRMMSVGIVVRLLLWLPTTLQDRKPLMPLVDEHWSIAAAIQDHDATLGRLWKTSQSIGAVALDLRTAAPLAASLHQKAIVVRVGAVNSAFCGGVDLAFTRRDFGMAGAQAVGIGDWQSGSTTPLAERGWPRQSPPPEGGYPAFPYASTGQFPEDLPANVYGAGNRHWHDQHLRLQGPIVASLEQQFAERWIIDTNGRVYLFNRKSWFIGFDDQVQLTSAACIASDPNGGKSVLPLPAAAPEPPVHDATATVQLWRTIPLRPGVTKAPFVRGEFTVMAGIAKAVSQSTSLITICDQYFWSVPLARLLAARMMACPTLRLLIVLPPYGAAEVSSEMALRKEAMAALWNGLDAGGRARVQALDMWSSALKVGVYVHAKAQSYDGALLVCGSANMNRRSLQCDAELDCAVESQPVTREYLCALYLCLTGSPWGDFNTGWLERYWSQIAAGASQRGTLIPDPFFAATVGSPKTPNGVAIPYQMTVPYWLLEPSSIGSPIERATCQFSQCPGDPKVPGRLDEITFLLERCHEGANWPWRVPALHFPAQDQAALAPDSDPE